MEKVGLTTSRRYTQFRLVPPRQKTSDNFHFSHPIDSKSVEILSSKHSYEIELSSMNSFTIESRMRHAELFCSSTKQIKYFGILQNSALLSNRNYCVEHSVAEGGLYKKGIAIQSYVCVYTSFSFFVAFWRTLFGFLLPYISPLIWFYKIDLISVQGICQRKLLFYLQKHLKTWEK